VVVRGPKLALRHLTAADAPALFELARDPEVTRFFSWGPYRDESEARAFVERLDAQRAAGERLELGIVGADDRPIGLTGLSELSRRDRRAVVGTWLGRAHWGSGANAESKALILSLAFRDLGMLRVSALANPENVRSIAALTRLGFVEEGVLRGWHVHGGERRDVAILRLSVEEFEASSLATVPYRLDGEPPAEFVVTPSGTSAPPR
jgi:ribosomal-protein-alanine N-acetyltransferase